MEGENHFRLPDRKFVLRRGEMLLMPPGVPHAETAVDRDRPFRMLVVILSPWENTYILGVKGPSGRPVVEQVASLPQDNPIALRKMVLVAREYLGQAGAGITGARLVGVLLGELLRGFGSSLLQGGFWGAEGDGLPGKATRLVRLRFRQADCNVASIAGELGVTPNHLSASYRAATGMRLTDRILRERMGQALRLLEESPELKVLDLAARCGYGHPSRFIAHFRSYTGRTPGEHRRTVLEGRE